MFYSNHYSRVNNEFIGIEYSCFSMSIITLLTHKYIKEIFQMNLLLAPFSLNVMSIKQLKMACSLEPTMSFIFINIPLFLASKSGTH